MPVIVIFLVVGRQPCMLEAIWVLQTVSPRSLYSAWVVGGHIVSPYRLLSRSFSVTDVVVHYILSVVCLSVCLLSIVVVVVFFIVTV